MWLLQLKMYILDLFKFAFRNKWCTFFSIEHISKLTLTIENLVFRWKSTISVKITDF